MHAVTACAVRADAAGFRIEYLRMLETLLYEISYAGRIYTCIAGCFPHLLLEEGITNLQLRHSPESDKRYDFNYAL